MIIPAALIPEESSSEPLSHDCESNHHLIDFDNRICSFVMKSDRSDLITPLKLEI